MSNKALLIIACVVLGITAIFEGMALLYERQIEDRDRDFGVTLLTVVLGMTIGVLAILGYLIFK